MKNYYEIIGVNVNADERTIKNAYLFKLKKYHPDLYLGDSEFAEQKTKELNLAYDTLKDKELRKAYDEQLGIRKNDNVGIRKNTYNSSKTNVNNNTTKTNGANNFYHQTNTNAGRGFVNVKRKKTNSTIKQRNQTSEDGFIPKQIKKIKNFFEIRKNNKLKNKKTTVIDNDRKKLNAIILVVLALFIICFAILIIF